MNLEQQENKFNFSIHWDWLKMFLRRNMFLHQLVMAWRSRKTPYLMVKKGETKICIEGYPRSSNSYLVRMFRLANNTPFGCHICHHTHSIHSVRKAIKFKIPVLIIIRNPIDAIISNCFYVGKFNRQIISIEINKYLDFYSWVSKNLDKIVLVKFEGTISNFNLVITKLNKRFDTKFNTFLDEKKANLQVIQEIQNNSPNKDDPYKIPIQNNLRKKMSDSLRLRVANHPKIKKALNLYYSLTNQ